MKRLWKQTLLSIFGLVLFGVRPALAQDALLPPPRPELKDVVAPAPAKTAPVHKVEPKSSPAAMPMMQYVTVPSAAVPLKEPAAEKENLLPAPADVSATVLPAGEGGPVPAAVAAMSNETRPAPAKSWLAQFTDQFSNNSPTNGDAISQDCGKRHWMIYGMVDYFMWRARLDQDPYAGVDNSTGGNVNIQAVSTSLKDNSGYRLTLGGRNDQGWDIFFNYTSFTDSGEGSVSGANNISFPQANGAVAQPATGDSASQRQSLRLAIYDFNVGKTAQPGKNWDFVPFAGFRYVNFNQGDNILYADTAGVYPVDSNMRMHGYGLRGGFNFDYEIGKSGFSVIGLLAGSVLFSQQDIELIQSNSATNQVSVYTASANTTVPVLETKLGGRYTFRNFFVGAGYEYSQWFNLNTQATTQPGTNPPNFQVNHNDISFGGWFVQGGFNY